MSWHQQSVPIYNAVASVLGKELAAYGILWDTQWHLDLLVGWKFFYFPSLGILRGNDIKVICATGFSVWSLSGLRARFGSVLGSTPVS